MKAIVVADQAAVGVVRDLTAEAEAHRQIHQLGIDLSLVCAYS